MTKTEDAVGVPVTEHIIGLRERAAAAFNLASAHARMADTMMRYDPNDPTVLLAVSGARESMTAALNLFNALSAARRQAGLLVVEAEHAKQHGELQ